MAQNLTTILPNIEPTTLQGHTVRLEPLGQRHAADLLAAAEPSVFAYHNVVPAAWTPDGFHDYVERYRTLPGNLAFAIVLRAKNTAIGATSYLDIRPLHRGLEIGGTWIGPRWQGTRVNPECKLLLLAHAFEALGALRVQLKCDARNVQSQRAIAKLGAVREGVLRKHMALPDGFVRDTVMFSIVADEWPAVKAGLERRLQA